MAEAFFALDLREEGVRLVRGRFSFSDEAFCSELAQIARTWLKESLFEYARQVYQEDTDRKKRFRFCPFDYSLVLKVSEGEVLVSASLVRGDRVLAAYEERLGWCEGAFCPLRKKK